MTKTMAQAMDEMLNRVRQCVPGNGDCGRYECCHTIRVLEEQPNPTAIQITWMSLLQAKKIPVTKADKSFSQCDSLDVISKFPSWNAAKNSFVMDPRVMPKQVYQTICSGSQSLGATLAAAAGAFFVATY